MIFIHLLNIFQSKAIRTVRTKQQTGQEEEYRKAPHSFVFHRGHVGKNILQLIKDMRQLMEPYTASKLQVHQHSQQLLQKQSKQMKTSVLCKYSIFDGRLYEGDFDVDCCLTGQEKECIE